jgi:chaperonin cofactor prefoldin
MEHRCWMIDTRAKLVEALRHAQEYLDLALKTQDRGEREFYERICELYMRIAQEFEALIWRAASPDMQSAKETASRD